MPASYFLGNRLLGTTTATPLWDDTTFIQSSQVFVCPTCGEAWGRIAMEGREWLPVRRGCPKHPWTEDIGGTFLPAWRRRLDDFPPEVVVYEFHLRLAGVPDAP